MLNLTQQDENGIRVVQFSGSLETNTSVNADEYLQQIISEGSVKIIADFRDLEYISSAGLRVLLATANRLQELGGDLAICHLNETVQEVFDISGFSTIFSVFETIAEAVASY